MKVGDRVVLTHGPAAASLLYPYQGTEFACPGQIVGIFIGSYSNQEMAQIEWDNGRMVETYSSRLKYESNELDQTNPNSTFLLEKRRRK